MARALLLLTSTMAMAMATMGNAEAAEDGFLVEYAKTRRFLSGRPVGAKVTKDNAAVLFLRSEANAPEQSLFELDVATGKTRTVVTPAQLLKGASEQLSAEERARLERQRVSARGFTSFELSPDGKQALVTLSGRLYIVERTSEKVRPLQTGEGAAIDAKFSPDGKRIAYVRENDVFTVDLPSGKERPVTRGGSSRLTHGLAEFVAQEEMGRMSGFWWSPDSRFIAYEEADLRQVEELAIVDVMHPEAGAHPFAYPRAGRKNAVVRLGIIPVGGGRTTWVDWDRSRLPYLATVVWPKKGPLTVLVQDRAQREEQLLAVDPTTGKTRQLLVERDAAWLNLDQDFPAWLEDGSGFFWMTERNGGPEVELRSNDGKLVGTWVKKDAGFASWVGFEPTTRTLLFTGSPNPTESLVFAVRDGGAPSRFGSSNLPAWQMAKTSDDGRLVVVASTTATTMPRTHVYRLEGAEVGELPSVAVEPSLVPNMELVRVGPGEGIHAAVLRPRTMKKGTKLPVVVEVYGGPGHGIVRHTMRENLLPQWLANRGYIVVKFDGRGTPRRGREYERAIQGDFATVTLGDQVLALEALGKRIPEMDLSRVGIEGWSFGGYMAALAVMRRPDIFKSAIAGAPVVDWRDYDTHYTERYLGLPDKDAKAYDVSSLLTYAPKLERPLLLIHGTADDNVYFLHTLKLSDALFRAGRHHEVLPLSGLTHMVPDPIVVERLWTRIAQQLDRTL